MNPQVANLQELDNRQPQVAPPRRYATRVVDAIPLELTRRVMNFLYDRQVPELEAVTIEDLGGGEVRVSGRMTTTYAKSRCLDCCRHVAGVIRVVDDLVVSRPRPK